MVSRGTTQQSSAPFNRRIVLITNNLKAIGPGWTRRRMQRA